MRHCGHSYGCPGGQGTRISRNDLHVHLDDSGVLSNRMLGMERQWLGI